MDYNWDSLGMKMPAARKEVDFKLYQPAAEWVKKHIAQKYGFIPTKVVLDDNLGWRFYDQEGNLLTTIDRDLMEKLALTLEKIEWNRSDQVGGPEAVGKFTDKILSTTGNPMDEDDMA
jgi:hypothetical protein